MSEPVHLTRAEGSGVIIREVEVIKEVTRDVIKEVIKVVHVPVEVVKEVPVEVATPPSPGPWPSPFLSALAPYCDSCAAESASATQLCMSCLLRPPYRLHLRPVSVRFGCTIPAKVYQRPRRSCNLSHR